MNELTNLLNSIESLVYTGSRKRIQWDRVKTYLNSYRRQQSTIFPAYIIKYKDKDVKILREKAGVISVNPIWVAVSRPYLYTAETLEELFQVFVHEWENNKYLAE